MQAYGDIAWFARPVSVAKNSKTQLLDSLAEAILLAQAKRSAAGDHDRAVVEPIVELRSAVLVSSGSRVDLGRTFHGQGFIRSFLIGLFQECV